MSDGKNTISVSADIQREFKKYIVSFFDFVYRNLYYLGRQTQRYTKRVVRKTVGALKRPLRASLAFLRFLTLAVNRYLFKSFHSFIASLKNAKEDFSEAAFQIKKLPKKEIRLRLGTAKEYFHKIRNEHREFLATVFNTAVPAAAFAVLLFTIGYWSNVTFAIELSYNDEVIGYVADEAVFLDAQAQANERLKLNTSFASDNVQTEINLPSYNFTVAKKTDLLDVSAMCDKLIDSSKTKITNACGIYINGEFICAVKNETDAISVFDAIKEKYVTENPNDIIDFVEDVDYVQGLYPDNENVIWDAKSLSARLNTKKTEAVYHTVSQGDTLSAIAQAYDCTSSELRALNPQIKDSMIYIGDKLLVSNEVRFIRVKVMKTEIREEEIAFETIKTNNPSLYSGTSKTRVKGKNGLARVTELISYVDGVRIGSEEISRTVILEPVSEKIDIGTKSTSGWDGSGSYTVTGTTGRFVWPAVGISQITRRYGSSGAYTGGYHKGIDITGGGAYGRRIVAADGGIVTFSGWNGNYGYCVIVNHGGGISTVYAHCSKLVAKVGQSVSQGQTIAYVGNSGYSFGPHLHFEVRVNGSPVNPYRYLS